VVCDARPSTCVEDLPVPSDENQLDLEPEPPGDDKQDDLATSQDEILQGVVAGDLDTLQQRVAWILNHFPETRDSDLKLQLEYWRQFEGYDDGPIEPYDLFELARLTSLARARAKLQNTYKLFQASFEIRKRRGKLSEEELQKAAEQRPSYPLSAVYADETGKNARHIILASVWFLHVPETVRFLNRLAKWRAETGFEKELHFRDLEQQDVSTYQAAFELFMQEAATVSFKAISIEREGVKRVDEALEELYYYLLLHGVEHEAESGRAPLPRGVQLWKDEEEKGRDKLLLAAVRDRIIAAGKTFHSGQLTADEFRSVRSEGQALIQIADLFAGSLNRTLNATGERRSAKDDFARYLLQRVGMPSGLTDQDSIGDMTAHFKL
jgi:hypothetical protein